MSPEQARGQILTGASDQFSLAVITYQMLTGVRPFEGDAPTTVMFKIVSEEPELPSKVNPKLPAALDAVLLRAMHKEPDERFAGCVQFCDALRSAWGMDTDATVAATPIAAPKKKRSLLPMMAAGAGIAAALALVGCSSLAGATRGRQKPPGTGTDASPTTPAAGASSNEPLVTIPEQPPDDGNVDSPTATDDVSANDVSADNAVDGEQTAPPGVADPDGTEQPEPAVAAPAAAEPAVVGEPFTVTSQPAGATVTLDGTDVGATPYEFDMLPGTRYALQLSLDGYSAAGWAFAIDDLSESQRTSATLHFPLQPDVAPGVVTVVSDYAVAATARPVGGGQTRRFNASSDLRMNLSPGSWVVTLSAPDVFLSEQSTVSVSSGETHRLSAPGSGQRGGCRHPRQLPSQHRRPLRRRHPAAGPPGRRDHEFLFEWPASGKSLTVNERIVRDGQRVFATAPQQ